MKNQVNTGVLKPIIKPTDWRTSGDTGIVWKDNCPDWTPFIPTYEAQQKNKTATQACATFSALNTIEFQIKQQTGIEVNLSDRFTAKMCGTTPQGAQLTDVLYSITHDGWLLEEDYPFSADMTPEEYYKEIPQALKDKALQNLAKVNWEVKYEWANTGDCHPDLNFLKIQLRQAPLQRATSYSSGMCNCEHATVVYKIDDQFVYVFDTYNGGLVKNPLTYSMPWLMKIVVQPKTIQPTNIPPITKDLSLGMKDIEVKYLQQKLIKLGFLSVGLDTGYYGPLTKIAVSKFQWAYKVANPIVLTWNGGKLVALATRTKLNSL
jgi:hypothetical protein